MSASTTRHRGALSVAAALALTAALIGVAFRSTAQKAQPSKNLPPVPVKVAQARVQDQVLTLSAVGQVQAAKQATVRARIEGLLTEVCITEGQTVREGEVLARLDDRSLRAQLAQAEGELRRLQAQWDLARLELQRVQDLVAQSAASTQQRDQQQALVAQLQAQVQSQQATVSQARTQLSYTVITAPFTGRVGLRQVDVGNVVRPSDTQGIVTLAQTQPLFVVFNAPQTRLGEVRQAVRQAAAGAASPSVRVSEREGGAILARGQLRSADNAVDPASGTLKLKAQLLPSGDRLWPGQFVAVTLNTGSISGALTVPASAVQRGLKGSFVWRVVQTEGSTRAHMVPVRALWQSDAVIVLESRSDGLRPGDTVVVDGQSRLKSQALVKVLPQPREQALASQP